MLRRYEEQVFPLNAKTSQNILQKRSESGRKDVSKISELLNWDLCMNLFEVPYNYKVVIESNAVMHERHSSVLLPWYF